MKKFGILTLTLCLVLGLTACGATTLPTPEEPTPPAVADTEDITYEVTTDPYEQDILAEDGTKLMHISLQLPHLQAYVNRPAHRDPRNARAGGRCEPHEYL